MSLDECDIIRSRKILDASRGRSCVCCGRDDGTVVRCHYSGMRQHSYGKGRSIKGHDLLAADLCSSCHSRFDSYEAGQGETKALRQIDQSEQFLHYIALTLVRDYHDQVITIP